MCRSRVTVPACPAPTHTALVSQSLFGLCFRLPIYLSFGLQRQLADQPVLVAVRLGLKGTFMNGSGHWRWPLPMLVAVRQHCRAAVKLHAVRESVRGAA